MTRKSWIVGAGLALAGSLGSAGGAHASEESEIDKTLQQLAVNELAAGVSVSPRGPSGACLFGLVVFDPTTATGRLWYATLLEALDSGAAIDLTYDRSGDQCRLKQVNIR